jgi:hypothetical protein
LLKAPEDILAFLLDVPAPDAFVGHRKVGDQFLGLPCLERIFMKGAPQGGG